MVTNITNHSGREFSKPQTKHRALTNGKSASLLSARQNLLHFSHALSSSP